MAVYQTFFNPATKQVRAVDISIVGGAGEAGRLYQQGWKTYIPTPGQTAQIVSQPTTPAIQPTVTVSAPARPSPLAAHTVAGKIDLVKVAKSGDRFAIAAAEKIFGQETMKDAQHLAKTPVTQVVYDKLGPGTREDVRVVTPVSLREYNVMSDKDKAEHFPRPKKVSAAVAAKLGPGTLGRTVQFQPSVWEALTPWAEEKGQKATAVEGMKIWADVFVPGVATVRHWDKMGVPEKVGSVALDLFILGGITRGIVRGGAAAIKPRFRTPQEVRVVLTSAKDAGTAHARLEAATTALRTQERVGGRIPGALTLADTRREVQAAANLSRHADVKFLRYLSGATQLTSRDLAAIQKGSKLPGLKKAIDSVGKQQDKLAKQWKGLAKWEREHGFSPAKFDPADELVKGKFYIYRGRLTEIQKTRTALDRALVRFGEVAQPRVKHTPASEFKGYQMKWGDAFSGPSGTKPLDDFDQLLKEAGEALKSAPGRERTKQIAREVSEKELKRLGIEPLARPKASGGKATAIMERAASRAEVKTLEGALGGFELSPKYAAVVEEAFSVSVPQIRRGLGIKNLLHDAPKIVRMTPNAIAQATPQIISQFYALQVISSVMAQPITAVDTKTEMKTAIQVNAAYQAALASGLQAAAAAYTETMKRTGSDTRARVAAYPAAKAAIMAQTAAMVGTKAAVGTRTAVRTKALRAVRSMIRPRAGLGGPGSGFTVRKVTGIAEEPGRVSFNSGIVKVTVHPPYREDDITYKRLKKPQTGRGSQEDTLKVTDGDAPSLLVLDRGIDRVAIRSGRRMIHSRQAASGPNVILKGGKRTKQRRGSLI